MVNKVKIFVSYHKKAPLIKSDVFVPIEVGRALKTSENSLEDFMIGDNEGENISDKNARYCELTAQYYVWKNYEKLGNPEYVGFVHYRRLFNFNQDIKYQASIYSGNIFDQLMLDSQNIENQIENYDMIIPEPVKLKDRSIAIHYGNGHHINDYKIALNILLEKYPEYKETVKDYNKSHSGYFTNCYIMKREEFFKYMEWLFLILFEADKKIPEYSDIYDNRVIGFIAERLFGIYVTQMQKEQKTKIKELPQVMYTPEEKSVIPIVFAVNNYYSMPLNVAITSILKNASPNEFYLIYVLCNKDKLNLLNENVINQTSDKINSSIVFVDISQVDFDKLPQTKSCLHISKETYYRYVIPSLFKNHDKVLYLDCDITVRTSLKELYDTDITDYYFAGVEDILEESNKARLGLDKYCNAGVMLLNLKKMREDNIEEKLFDYTINNQDKIVWQDQDVMNVVMQEGILYLPILWNAQIRDCDKDTKFIKVQNSAKIIHYVGYTKPWNIEAKSQLKKEFYKYYNMMKLHNIVLSLSRYSFTVFLYRRIYRLLKNYRKEFIWYDKETKSIIIFSRFSFKVGK